MLRIATFLCLLPLTALANEEPPAVNATTPLAVAGTSLTFQLIALTDQRCPADADCYWEGMVRADIRVTDGPQTTIITLCNLCEGASTQATAFGHTITLGRLSPSVDELATYGRPPVLADYSLGFSVSPSP